MVRESKCETDSSDDKSKKSCTTWRASHNGDNKIAPNLTIHYSIHHNRRSRPIHNVLCVCAVQYYQSQDCSVDEDTAHGSVTHSSY